MRDTRTKEQVYDEEVKPLLDHVIAICQRRKIAMLASFAIDSPATPGLRATTITVDETGRNPGDQMRALRCLMSQAQIEHERRHGRKTPDVKES